MLVFTHVHLYFELDHMRNRMAFRYSAMWILHSPFNFNEDERSLYKRMAGFSKTEFLGLC